MSVNSICHKYMKNALPSFNQARIKTLLNCSNSLIRSDRLTLTDLGRNLSGKAKVKHKIKQVDRLLSNKLLHQDMLGIYKGITQHFFKSLPYYIIAVDWSGCCRNDYHLLRASLVVEGRSLPIYNKIVSVNDYETAETHLCFLKELHHIINSKKKVYIITDGGYRTPWFTEVLKLGWHFIGRLRGNIQSQLSDGYWQTVKQLHASSSNTPQYLGEARFGKSSKHSCRGGLHLYKGKDKKRHGKSRFTKDNQLYKNMAKEPWLIACSDKDLTSQEVITLYSKRMQIEQNFRDDKSQRYGFSWRLSKSSGIERLSVLCLIACISTFSLWFIGFEAEKRGLQYDFQANSTKKRRVLSFLFLAKQILKQFPRMVTIQYVRCSRKKFCLEYDKLLLNQL